MKLNLKERKTKAKGWAKNHPNLVRTVGIALATSAVVVVVRTSLLSFTEGE